MEDVPPQKKSETQPDPQPSGGKDEVIIKDEDNEKARIPDLNSWAIHGGHKRRRMIGAE